MKKSLVILTTQPVDITSLRDIYLGSIFLWSPIEALKQLGSEADVSLLPDTQEDLLPAVSYFNDSLIAGYPTAEGLKRYPGLANHKSLNISLPNMGILDSAGLRYSWLDLYIDAVGLSAGLLVHVQNNAASMFNTITVHLSQPQVFVGDEPAAFEPLGLKTTPNQVKKKKTMFLPTSSYMLEPLSPTTNTLVKTDEWTIDPSDEASVQPPWTKEIEQSELRLQTQIDLLSFNLTKTLKHISEAAINNAAANNVPTASAALMSTSQLGQDLWVAELFGYKRDGFFVEFGATDGVQLSNTFMLERELGWSGILAEPNPKFFSRLIGNRNCQCLKSCIGPRSGDVVEFVLADEYGGIETYAGKHSHEKRIEAFKASGESFQVETISLDDFLTKNNCPKKIDYLSIDTEGSELAILENFPIDKWEIASITVEHNFEPQREEIYKLLSAAGYERIEQKWDDWYFRPDLVVNTPVISDTSTAS